MNKNRLITLIILFSAFSVTSCNIGSGGGTSFNPNIYLDKSSIEFSGTVTGNYIDRTINIGNSGNEELTIGEITASDEPFYISSDTCSGETLSPLETCSIKARFKPEVQGTHSGTISIPSNDPDSETTTVPLSGEGYGLNVWIRHVDTSVCSAIKIYIAVADSSNVLSSLPSSNFNLKLNGIEKANFNISNSEYVSASIVLALDLSGSLTSELVAIKSAASSFIDLLDDSDEAAICKFNADISLLPNTAPLMLPGDDDGQIALITHITSDFTGTGGTALFNAVFNSISRTQEGINTKSAVLVLSDGNDNFGDKTLSDVITYSKSINVPVFSIYYVDPDNEASAKPEIMEDMALDTYGKYYSSDKNKLENIYTQISSVLNEEYEIQYSSDDCTGTVEIEVRVEISNGQYGIDSKTIELD